MDEIFTSAEIVENDTIGDGPMKHNIDGTARELLVSLAELPFIPVVPKIVQPQPPVPGSTTLPPASDLTRLRVCLIPNEKSVRMPTEEAAQDRKPWKLEDSIFASKVKLE